MAVLRPRLPSAPCWCPCAASLTVAASCTPARVCTRLSLVLAVPSCAPVSAAAPPQRLQRCTSFCSSLFKLSSPLQQLSSRLNQSPPSRPSRAGSPSPATRPVRALRRGAPRARPGGVLARVGGASGAGRRQARAPAGAEWHGVGGRGRWKRPFDFPILPPTCRSRPGHVTRRLETTDTRASYTRHHAC
jgi:hypothetical protein